jgi:hypothetical protein
MSIRRVAESLGLIVAMMMTSACMKTSVAVQPVPGSINPDHATHSHQVQFYFWGLKGDGTIDTAKVCPEGLHWVQTHMTFEDALLRTITLGIYSPKTVAMKCASGQAFLVEPVEDQDLMIATLMNDDAVADLEATQ